MAMQVKVHRRALRQLLRSREVLDDLAARAERVAEAAGPGMVASAQTGKVRARASVITGDADAMLAEADHKMLTRAVDAARG